MGGVKAVMVASVNSLRNIHRLIFATPINPQSRSLSPEPAVVQLYHSRDKTKHVQESSARIPPFRERGNKMYFKVPAGGKPV